MPRKRPVWLLIIGSMLAVVAGALYVWKKSQHPEVDELLRFTSLYIACPLALAMLSLFAYFTRK